MHPPPLAIMDIVGPIVGACVAIASMSLVQEPARQKLNAVIVAGAAGAYLSGGFGLWELVFPLVAVPIAYRGLQSYRCIAIAWLMHSAWDLAHHLWGQPIWPFMPTSSFGCMILDAVIATWFFMQAPSVWPRRVRVAAERL